MKEYQTVKLALRVLEDLNKLSLPPHGIPLPAEIDEAMDGLRTMLVRWDARKMIRPKRLCKP